MSVIPPTKRPKTLAPVVEPRAAPSRPLPYEPFVPLPILQPTSSYEVPVAATGRHVSRRTVQEAPQKATSSLACSPLAWDSQAQASYGSPLDIPESVASALKFTDSKGQKPSTLPKQLTCKNLRHSGAVFCAKWSPRSGQLLLTAGADGLVKIWDPLRTKKQVAEITLDQVHDAAFSDDSRSILCGGYGNRLCQVDLETGKILVNLPQEAHINCVDFFDHNTLVCGLSSGCVVAIDPRDPSTQGLDTSSIGKADKDSAGRYIKRIQGVPGSISSFTFLPGSQPTIVTCTEPKDQGGVSQSVAVWNWETGVALSNSLFADSAFPCFYVRRHPTLSQFAAQCSSGSIPVFSANEPWKRKKQKKFAHHRTKGFLCKFDFSPDGAFLYSGSATGSLYVYQYSNSTLLKAMPVFEPTDPCLGVAHHPTLNSVVAVTSWSGKVHIYE